MDFDIENLLNNIDAVDDESIGVGGDEFYDEADVEEGEVVPKEEQERLYQAYLAGLVDNDGNPIAAPQKPSEAAEAASAPAPASAAAPAPAAQPKGKRKAASPKGKDAKPAKAKSAKVESAASAEPAEAAKPVVKRVKVSVKKRPVKAEGGQDTESVAQPTEDAGKPPEGEGASEGGNPYVRVTTDGRGRAQLGEEASAPSAKWKVEVIDPKTGEPIPFTEDGKSEEYIEGPPLYNYMYLTKMLVPEIAGRLAEQGLALDTGNIRGVVDRTSVMEDKQAIAEDKAFDRLLSAINGLKGTKAYRYLTETKLRFPGPVGDVEAKVAPQNMIRQMERHNISLESLGATKAQADELRKASAVAVEGLGAIEDRISGRRQSDKYWSDQFEQGLNLGGNLQSMYNYMLMDPSDPTRPSVNAWKNGQPLWEVGWSNFFDNTGPTPVRRKVHPGLDMPFLYADSEESKALLDELGLGDDTSKLTKEELAGKLNSLKDKVGEAYGDLFKKDADLGEGEGKRYVVLQNSDGETLIPAWDLIKKYEGIIGKSLGENWARFMRGTGGYKWSGSAGSQRLRQGGDIETAQYNPVLRDLLGRAEAEAPWLVPILQNYYLNYGEEPFVPDEKQLDGFMRQLSEKPEEAFAFLTDSANTGSVEGKTGLTRTSLKRVADSLMTTFLRSGEAAGIGDESLIEAFNRVSPRSVLAPNDEERVAMFAKKGKKPNGKWGPSQNLMDKLLGDMKVTEKIKSPEWKKLVLRAMMEEAFENPEMQARVADPTGFHLTHHIADTEAPGRRAHEAEKMLNAERDRRWDMQEALLSLGILPENLVDAKSYDDRIAEKRKLYDEAMDRARRQQSRLALRILDMLMNGDSNMKYRNGFGLYRDIFDPESDTESDIFDTEADTKSDSRMKRRVRRGKAVRPSFAESLASQSMAGSVSDAREKEPCSWESWEARRKELIGEDK